MQKILTFLCLVLACNAVFVEGTWRCSSCKTNYKALGCYKDDGQRSLPKQILNERDVTSEVFEGHLIDWKNWDNYIAEFTCRCAAKAKQLGYRVFALQFFGECWSGPHPESYKRLGKVGDKDIKQCIGQQYAKCSRFSRHCVGQHFMNFVYEIVPDCDIQFESLGCYKDLHVEGARPLPEYVMTDRDKSRTDIYSSITIDWRNWDVYMPDLVCRCAKKAKSLGATAFAIQYYGECWTGPKAHLTYNRDGASSSCVDRCFKICKPHERFCVGKQYANYVYRLSGPASQRKKSFIPEEVASLDNFDKN